MPLKLVGIGLVAGLFSALFGVGGGIVIVPLLILLLGFDGRVATGTSLAAIGITALAGTVLYGFEGQVDVGTPRSSACPRRPARSRERRSSSASRRGRSRSPSPRFLTAIGVWLLVG